MNYQKNKFNEIIVNGSKIIINNIEYILPKKCSGNNITSIDDKIYINGYEFKNGKFKKTISALFHKWF